MKQPSEHRNSVVVIAYKNDLFLVVQRIHDPKDYYKFVQGGIDNGEDVISAARRELAEEVHITDVRIVGVSTHTNTYDWSDETIKRTKRTHGEVWPGQTQRFVVAEIQQESVTLNPNELSDYAWISKETVLKQDAAHTTNSFSQYNHTITDVLEEFNI